MSNILYAAYGSNLLKERFMFYINGGEFRGNKYKGCSDKTEPVDCGWMFVPHRIYFAKSSGRWQGKGVAFMSTAEELNKEFHAVVRLWKVTQKQFDEIQEQERTEWYPCILKLGQKDGLEIMTFTGCWESEKNAPCEKYLNVIKAGLKETTGWDDDKIKAYLESFLKKDF